jgi:hypothetical protein
VEPNAQGLAEDLSWLGEDLLLLSVRPRDGWIVTIQRIDYGLMGSELIRLAALGRVSVDERRITVLNAGPTGDAELDAALASLAGGKQLRPKTWVSHRRHGIRDAYLERLVATGALRCDRSGLLGRKRWVITAPQRADQARARLDAIAHSTGPVDLAQAAFGGLAHAVNLDGHLYPRFADRPLRRRLAEVGSGKWTRTAVDAVGSAARAASDAAAQAAVRAAADAAIQAAVQASTAAAISAAASAAAADSGGHAGAGAHGHH